MTEQNRAAVERRTKRRYAHELYPHAEEGQTRPLAVEVPYLYARAIGFETWGTGWFAHRNDDQQGIRESGSRIERLVDARRIAFLADAMLQGLVGDEAWAWADMRSQEPDGEWVGERSTHYGVPFNDIKPYPCGPEPEEHFHYGEPDANGYRSMKRAPGKESECEDCTEPMHAECEGQESLL